MFYKIKESKSFNNREAVIDISQVTMMQKVSDNHFTWKYTYEDYEETIFFFFKSKRSRRLTKRIDHGPKYCINFKNKDCFYFIGEEIYDKLCKIIVSDSHIGFKK